MNQLLIGGFGFAIWLLATIVFRVIGHEFFLIDNGTVMVGLWVLAGIGLVMMTIVIFRWQEIERSNQYEAAILLVVPGMIGDALTSQFFDVVLPNMDIRADGSFAAWLLFAYAVVLITGLWSAKRV